MSGQEVRAALIERAQSYFRDSLRFADMPPTDLASAGLTHEQWAVIYRTLADELHKAAEGVRCG